MPIKFVKLRTTRVAIWIVATGAALQPPGNQVTTELGRDQGHSRLKEAVHTDKTLERGDSAQALGFDYGGPTKDITWAGWQWSYSIDQSKGHLVAGVPIEETHIVTSGEVNIEVSDSDAVLVAFYGM